MIYSPKKPRAPETQAKEVTQAKGLKKNLIIAVLVFLIIGFIKSLRDFRLEAGKYDLKLREMSDLWWIGFFSLVNLVSAGQDVPDPVEHQTHFQLLFLGHHHFWYQETEGRRRRSQDQEELQAGEGRVRVFPDLRKEVWRLTSRFWA